MSEEKAGAGTLLRAGRAIGGAVLTPSGARWARPRRTGRTLVLGALALGAAAAAYAASTTTATVPQGDRSAIEQVVRDYLMEHPEVIREAMQKLEQKRVAAIVDENRTELETPRAGAWDGAEKGDVTLVAFMDYACGYCRASLPDLERLVRDDPKLRIVYRELPIISEGSPAAARVSLYAAENGRFREFHKAMYAEGGVDTDKIMAAAKKAGLDPAKAKAELTNAARNEAITADVRLAQSLEAQGTPLFVIGDKLFYGAVGYDQLKDAIDAARKKS